MTFTGNCGHCGGCEACMKDQAHYWKTGETAEERNDRERAEWLASQPEAVAS